MYDEVIKRIDAKNNFRFISSREDKKQAVIKADSLKLKNTYKKVLLIKKGRVSEK
jgi:predicted DCC family thiol-disulfide oxidoreductase YuxK